MFPDMRHLLNNALCSRNAAGGLTGTLAYDKVEHSRALHDGAHIAVCKHVALTFLGDCGLHLPLVVLETLIAATNVASHERTIRAQGVGLSPHKSAQSGHWGHCHSQSRLLIQYFHGWQAGR